MWKEKGLHQKADEFCFHAVIPNIGFDISQNNIALLQFLFIIFVFVGFGFLTVQNNSLLWNSLLINYDVNLIVCFVNYYTKTLILANTYMYGPCSQYSRDLTY